MANITAQSLSQPDVATAVNQAQSGDTVILPAGDQVWTASVEVRKSLTIQGQGATLTKLKRDSNNPTFRGPFFYLGELTEDAPLRLTGVGMDNRALNPNYDTYAVYVRGTQGKSFGLTKVRIDHCSFNAGKRPLWVGNWAYGVCDHCDFKNVLEFFISVREEGYPALDRKKGGVFGSLDAWYVEDCTFVNDDGVPDMQGTCDADGGASMVIRYNTYDIKNSGGHAVWLSHGNQSYWAPTGNYFLGSYRMEVYKNKATVPSSYRWSYFRGGRVLMWANQLTTRDGSNAPIAGICEEEGNPDYFNPKRTTWPGEHQIHASFFWENTCNGNPCASPQLWFPTDGTFLQEGRDYWLKAPASDTKTTYPKCGSPSSPNFPYQIGSGGAYPPVTSFTPAPYPHPLISGQEPPPGGGGETPPPDGGGTPPVEELVVTVISPPGVKVVVQQS